jgi:hypothetical protein
MNLLLLPKQLQDLISEFNVEHRPLMRVVINELLIKYEERIENDKYCVNCGNDAEEQYSNYILWHKYTFCGGWCSYDTEYHLRKSYRDYQKRKTLRR